MTLRNTQSQYGSVAKFFHWLIAVLVILMIIGGVSLGYLPRGPLKSLVIQIHKSTGVTILGLMILRLLWRFCNPSPKLPPHVKLWQQTAAHVSHGLLYITVIAMPISGILMSLYAGYPVSFWGLFNVHIPGITKNTLLAGLFNDIHTYLAWVISILICIHVLGALKHHFIDKDDVLKRMMPGK